MLNKSKIKFFRSLQQKKYRDLNNCYLAEGKKIVSEALQTQPNLVKEVICTEKLSYDFNEFDRQKLVISDYRSIKQISSLKKDNLQNILDYKKNNPYYAVLTTPQYDYMQFSI